MSDIPPPVSVTVTPPEPGFQVTLRDVYDKLGEVAAKVDRMQDLPGDVKDHEKRLRELETNQTHFVTTASARWWFTAIVALVVAATGVMALLIR